jgi:hypothetical protein
MKADELQTGTHTLAYVTPVKKTTLNHQNASNFKDLPGTGLYLHQEVSKVCVVFMNTLRKTDESRYHLE